MKKEYNDMNPAIVVVAYNRPDSMLRLLQSLDEAFYEANDIELIISIDKADNIDDVVAKAQSFEWTHGRKVIRTFPERQGLRKHIISCGELSNEYGSIILLEDDLIVSPGFYCYVKKALGFYSGCDEIAGIALYSHEWNGYGNCFFNPIVDEFDTFLGQFSITWGQCWTKKWWNEFKEWYKNQPDVLPSNPALPDNINRWSKQSWGRYFVNFLLAQNKYYVIPRFSFSTNFCEIGQHVSNSDTDHQVRVVNGVKKDFNFASPVDAERYDVFFESLNTLEYIDEDIVQQGIDLDLAGYGRNNPNNRYVLSTKPHPYKIICSFGMKLRPIEMNVRKNIKGNDIFIYDKTIVAKKGRYHSTKFRYEIRGFATKDILRYTLSLVLNKLRNKK